MMQGISCDAEDSAVTRQHGCLTCLKHHCFCHAAAALNFCHTWTSETKHVLAMQGRRAMRRSQGAATRKLPQKWRTPRRGCTMQSSCPRTLNRLVARCAEASVFLCCFGGRAGHSDLRREG